MTAGEASALVIDEVVQVRHRRSGNRRLAMIDGRAAAAMCVLHPVTDREIDAALELFVTYPGLQMRDAIHVATARRHAVAVILCTDRGIDSIAGLRRVEPADNEAVAALVGDRA
ncbi:hypothetical protein BH20ACT5_BH20ACT5_20000 [soil metagenome]